MRVSVAILLLSLVAPVARADFDCATSLRCVDVAIPAPGLIVPDNRVRIFLPSDYAAAPEKRYPVLYLLHGAGDTYETWSKNTDAYDFTAGHDVIVVMPDGGHGQNAGWYSDWADGSRQWESFHIGKMIPYVDANFRTLGEGHRVIAGLSMGGFGAMHYAARHAGLFDAAASFSGATDVLFGFPLSGVAFAALHDQFGTPNDNVWGNQITARENWEANNPASRASDLKGTPLFLASGDGVPLLSAASPLVGGPDSHEDPENLGGYGIELFIFPMNLSFVLQLELAGVAHTDWFYPGGHHDWPYWQDALHWALPLLLEAIP